MKPSQAREVAFVVDSSKADVFLRDFRSVTRISGFAANDLQSCGTKFSKWYKSNNTTPCTNDA